MRKNFIQQRVGNQITLWENKENQILKRNAMRTLNADLKALEVPRKIWFF